MGRPPPLPLHLALHRRHPVKATPMPTTPHPVHSYAAAARLLGITPATVRSWVRDGRLPEQPWDPNDLRARAAEIVPATPRSNAADHGTPSKWRSGCDCPACTHAHNADLAGWRADRRTTQWAPLVRPFLDDVAAGTPYATAVDRIGMTVQAVTAHRRRDPEFARQLDQALLEGRDPTVAHGTPAGWKAPCRCPECRAHHNSTR